MAKASALIIEPKHNAGPKLLLPRKPLAILFGTESLLPSVVPDEDRKNTALTMRFHRWTFLLVLNGVYPVAA